MATTQCNYSRNERTTDTNDDCDHVSQVVRDSSSSITCRSDRIKQS